MICELCHGRRVVKKYLVGCLVEVPCLWCGTTGLDSTGDDPSLPFEDLDLDKMFPRSRQNLGPMTTKPSKR